MCLYYVQYESLNPHWECSTLWGLLWVLCGCCYIRACCVFPLLFPMSVLCSSVGGALHLYIIIQSRVLWVWISPNVRMWGRLFSLLWVLWFNIIICNCRCFRTWRPTSGRPCSGVWWLRLLRMRMWSSLTMERRWVTIYIYTVIHHYKMQGGWDTRRVKLIGSRQLILLFMSDIYTCHAQEDMRI